MSSICTFCAFDINFEQRLRENFNKRGLRSHDFFIYYLKKIKKIEQRIIPKESQDVFMFVSNC